jgi:predicted acyltransferase
MYGLMQGTYTHPQTARTNHGTPLSRDAYHLLMATNIDVSDKEITTLPPVSAEEISSNGDQPKAEAPEPVKAPRILSLDAFRGLTILLMLLVNNVALDVFTPKHLTHAAWNGGVNLADLVAPWFLFCVGVAIPFSAASFAKTGKPAWHHDIRILRRGLLLVLLGCLIDSSIYNGPVFCLDVLQIIGLAYVVGALLYDLPLSRRMCIAGLLLAGYWAFIKFVPIPGEGAGFFAENHNLITHINQNYLSAVSLVGIFSLIPTAALVLIGSAIGDLMRRRDRHQMWTVAWLMMIGVALSIAGIAWNASLAFNKPLWTPSYVLLAAGTGSMVLSLFYLIIDTHRWSKWAFPLIVFGANAIVAYVAPILVKLLILQKWHVAVPGHGHVQVLQRCLDVLVAHYGRVPGGWLYTIGYIVVWWLVLWQLYRRKLFLRV